MPSPAPGVGRSLGWERAHCWDLGSRPGHGAQPMAAVLHGGWQGPQGEDNQKQTPLTTLPGRPSGAVPEGPHGDMPRPFPSFVPK